MHDSPYKKHNNEQQWQDMYYAFHRARYKWLTGAITLSGLGLLFCSSKEEAVLDRRSTVQMVEDVVPVADSVYVLPESAWSPSVDSPVGP